MSGTHESPKTREVKDEDGELVGEVRRCHVADLGYMWRAWAFRNDFSYDHVWTKLELHDTPDGAENEIHRYWGMIL